MHQMVSMTDSIFSEHKKYLSKGNLEFMLNAVKKGRTKINIKFIWDIRTNYIFKVRLELGMG